MKRALAAAILMALLFIAIAVTLFANLGKAQNVLLPAPSHYCTPPPAPRLELNMPTWRSFGTDSLTLSFTLTMSWGNYNVSPIQYYVDGSLQGETAAFEFTPVIIPIPTNSISKTCYFTLTGLSEGIHTLELVAPQISWASGDWVENQLWPWGYGTNFSSGGYTYGGPGYDYPDLTAEFGPISLHDWFTISFPSGYDDTAPPSVTFLTIQNKTYDCHEFFLRFTLNEQASWIGFGLDGGNSITITDEVNQTSFQGQNRVTIIATAIVKGVAAGIHTLKIYATDTAGNTGESELFHFTMATEEQPEPDGAEPEPNGAFPATLLIAIVASVAIVSIGLLVYFKKRRRR